MMGSMLICCWREHPLWPTITSKFSTTFSWGWNHVQRDHQTDEKGCICREGRHLHLLSLASMMTKFTFTRPMRKKANSAKFKEAGWKWKLRSKSKARKSNKLPHDVYSRYIPKCSMCSKHFAMLSWFLGVFCWVPLSFQRLMPAFGNWLTTWAYSLFRTCRPTRGLDVRERLCFLVNMLIIVSMRLFFLEGWDQLEGIDDD